MALIKWKQISDQLGSYGNLTGSLDVSGSISVNGQLISNGADITSVVAGDGLSGGATSGEATLALNTGSVHFISGTLDLAVFKQTGSIYATTNNLQVTGSLTLREDDAGDVLAIFSGSTKTFSITEQGILRLVTQSSTPSAVAGGLYLDTNYNLYIGSE